MDVVIGVLILVIAIFVLTTLAKAIRTVPQQRMDVVERLGKYKRTLSPGLNILVPFVDAVRTKVDMREQVVSFPPQPVITSDNLVVSIDTVLYFRVVDPVRATYEIANFLQAIEQLTVTTLRNVIGSLDLERALTSREEINRHLSGVLDETTGRWGIKVTRVEIKAIEPPPSIRDSMEKQMRAERDRRAAILNAEGHKQAQILTAEGEKQAAVLRADGDRQARILQAEGQAKAIRTVFDAIHTSNPSQKVLAYQYIQALPQIANGSANKVWIVPAELNKALEGLGGALGGLANMVGDKPTAEVDAGAVEREAVEAAEAAAAEAEKVDAAVRAAEAQVSGGPAQTPYAASGGAGDGGAAALGGGGTAALPAPEPVPPSAALGSADYNGAGEPERG
jgi:regulator of protease activity HflC (stomatin/prohibitin superfamily)